MEDAKKALSTQHQVDIEIDAFFEGQGLLLLFFGNTIIVGDYRGIIAVIIVFFAFWFKLLKEEKTLEETFGHQYLAYKEKTFYLIPFIL